MANPLYPVADPAHPHNTGIVGWWTYRSGVLRDIGPYRREPTVAAGTTTTADFFGAAAGSGVGLYIPGTSGNVAQVTIPAIGTGEFSLEVICMPRSVTFFKSPAGFDSTFEIYQNNTALSWRSSSWQFAAGIAIGVPYTVTATRKGAAINLYYNGVRGSGQNDSTSITSTTLTIGGGNSTTDLFVGNIISVRLTTHGLSDAEVLDRYLWPWAGLKPKSRRILVPSVSGAIPTLSNPTYKAGTLTSVGFTPEVTVS